jgi:hypothetical protein
MSVQGPTVATVRLQQRAEAAEDGSPLDAHQRAGKCERRTDHAAGRAFAYSKSSGGCSPSTAFCEELSHHPLDVLLMKHRMPSAHARTIPAIRA